MDKDEEGVYYLRSVGASDEELLLKWANDKTVRKNAFHQNPISQEEHKNWFRKALLDKSIIIFILIKNEVPVGQCRLNVEGDVAEIDYSIEKSFRGQGAGKTLLELVENEVKLKFPQIKRLIGKVKPENLASVQCFERSKYAEVYRTYEKEL